MSCVEEFEDIIKRISPRLKDCTMAIYNGGDRLPGSDVEVLCSMGGAKCGKVFTVSSVSQRIGGFISNINALVTHANSYTKHDPMCPSYREV